MQTVFGNGSYLKWDSVPSSYQLPRLRRIKMTQRSPTQSARSALQTWVSAVRFSPSAGLVPFVTFHTALAQYVAI